ncbi:solute carrier family 22 member 2 isoform X4 [Betta splendens]|uniref:Solute carrier family 22 member 2 isoform X4 n=1 Tax=Betta splendens TaxID=158456 RepID=A0A6P7LP04_BETSP|nr:solute carrier family 22 member 2 isoform X4 [Betta splendens]
MTTFDDLLEEAGPFGRCQKRVFGLFCLLSSTFPGMYLGIVFQGFTPDHWCRDPAALAKGESCGWSPEDVRRRAAPGGNGSSSCERYEVDWNSSSLSCDILDLQLSGAAVSGCKVSPLPWRRGPVTCSSVEQSPVILVCVGLNQCLFVRTDGRTTTRAGSPSSPSSTWSAPTRGWWTCSCPPSARGTSSAASLSATLPTGDDLLLLTCWAQSRALALTLSRPSSLALSLSLCRFGRKLCFLVADITSVVSGLVMAAVPHYVAVLVLRVAFGLALKGVWMSSYVLLTEIVGVQYRRGVCIGYQMAFSAGVLLLPLLAYFISDWRWLQVAVAAPGVVFLSFYWFLPESPRWLISQNNPSKALEVTEAMAKENGRTVKAHEELSKDAGDSPAASLLDLVRTPNMRKHTFILMFNWFTSAVVYQGLILRVGIAGGNVYVDFFLSGLVEFPAAFLILLTIDRVGRRLPFAGANITAGASCLLAAFLPDRWHWLKTVVACVGRLGITMAFEMVLFVNAELYPTFVRCFSVCGRRSGFVAARDQRSPSARDH